MKKIVILGLALALVGGAAYANFCARDFVPAATLLVPYAVVAVDSNNVPDPNGFTTILDVTNVSSAKQIIHIVVWDALSDAIVDFDEVLSGYDVWQINFRDLLNGAFNLFDTGAAGTGNGVGSDHSGPKFTSTPAYPELGGFWLGPANVGTATSTWASGEPGWGGGTPTGFPTQYGPSSNTYFTNAAPSLPVPQDVDFTSNAGCNFPYGPIPGLGPTIVSLLQTCNNLFTVPGPGLPQDAEFCIGGKPPTIASPAWLGSMVANPVWFYVTVDVVSGCNKSFPNSADYWGDPTGQVYPTANNVIIGNIFYLSPAGNYSDSIPAVSIEADTNWGGYLDPNSTFPTGVGFYNQYTQNFAVPFNDFHEPLGTAYAFEYYNDLAAGITSNLMVWKNTTELAINLAGTEYVWDACLPYIYYAWDQNENALARGGGGPSGFGTAEPNALPYQTQKVPLTPANFDGIPAAEGWMLLVFDPSIRGMAAPPTDVGAGPRDTQAWAGVQYYWGSFSTELEAATLANYWCFRNQILPAFNTYDGTLLHNNFLPNPK